MRSPFTRQAPRSAADEGKAPEESRSSVARFILLLAILAWAVRSFVAAPFSIPSGSMLPTLYVGDYLVVAKWPYGYSRYSFLFGIPSFDGRILSRLPRRGDVVVFHHPAEDMDLIKRVIALPGDRVAVSGGQVILNGRPLPREPLPAVGVRVSANSPCKTIPPASAQPLRTQRGPACGYPAFRETLPGGPSYTVLDQLPDGDADERAAVRVPAGHVFLMGDNRDDSLDSRYPVGEGGVGMVPMDHLIGRALVTFWSTDGSASYWKPWTWVTALRPERIGNDYSGALK